MAKRKNYSLYAVDDHFNYGIVTMLDENGKKVTKASLDYIDKATIHFNGPKHLITHLEKNEKGIEENNYIKKSHI